MRLLFSAFLVTVYSLVGFDKLSPRGSTRLPFLPEQRHLQRKTVHFLCSLLFALLCLFASATSSIAKNTEAQQSESPIVINEIHYDPSLKTDTAEFVELFNRSAESVDLSGWALDDAIEYTFPEHLSIGPGEYLVLAQNPETVQRFWAQPSFGPYRGKLSSQGERLVLRDRNAKVVDEVDYKLGFPWPTVGDAPGPSIGLIHPALDNNQGAAWRSALPTPNLRNTTFVENPPPLVSDVAHFPQQPAAQEPVRISANIVDAESAVLFYQIVEPGNYIALDAPEYATNWIQLAMTPGVADVQAADGKISGTIYSAEYSAEIPPTVQLHRRLIRYRIQALDGAGAVVSVPYTDDPQPNFAYFVYDGVPPWQGAAKPGSSSSLGKIVSHDFNAMRPMATYHLLSQHDDIRSALFSSGYPGSEYLWQGTFVYDGVVYDHIRYRARGGFWRYSLGKNMVKFDFNRGRWFQAHDDYGNPYSVKWDKLNLSAVIQHGERKHRGEQGLFESVGYRLFNLAGVESPKTHFIHFRVIDSAEEAPKDQYDGDFFGLYLVLEQMDGQFLKEHELADGNLYKMEHGSGERNNQGAGAVTDRSDLASFIRAYKSGDVEDSWWRANFDLDRYYSFRSILEAIHHYDVNNEKNYFYFHNPDTDQWSILPWDIDQTWADNMFGSGTEPFKRYGVLRKDAFEMEYQNRLRELRDLLFNVDQVTPLIAEYAVMIDSPAGASMVDADRARWDYSKEMDSKWTAPQKAGRGLFYERSPTGDFAGMARVMREWVVARGAWIDKEILKPPENKSLPTTPNVTYSGPAGYPADQLRFVASPFRDPQGDETFAAMKWRIAELNYPAIPTFRADEPHRYEIESTWESEKLTAFTEQVDFPAGSCRPGHTCRVRVRMLDTSGRWSHWSPPIEFVAGRPAQPATNALRITEIMYHPLNDGSREGNLFEFIEVQNVGEQPIDLTNMRFTDGINYRFAVGASLGARERLLLASSAEDFQKRYGIAPFGDYGGRLSNAGERLLLEDAFGRPVVEVEYDDNAPWPPSADGSGRSIVLRPNQPISAPGDATIWRGSTIVYGSPGAADPLPIVINEVLANPGEGQSAGIELYNPSAEDAPVGKWTLSTEPANGAEPPIHYMLPSNVILPPDGYHFIPHDELQKAANGSAPLVLDATGGTLLLAAATADGQPIGYQNRVASAGSAQGVSVGRYVDSVGREHFVAQSMPTLGMRNAPPAVGPVVVSKIMYHPLRSDEFVELTNISTETVKLYEPSQPELTWRMQGIDYQFPTGLEIAPNGRILITLAEPADVCLSSIYRNLLGEAGNFELDLQVVGPFQQALPDISAKLVLQRPMPRSMPTAGEEQPAYITVDAVEFQNSAPWPSDVNGTDGALERLFLERFGNDPANWTSSQPLDAAAAGPQVDLCSFTANGSAEASSVLIRWTTDAEQDVQGYHLLRNSVPERAGAVRISDALIPLSSIPLSSIPLSSIPLSSTDLAGASARNVYDYVDESILQGPDLSYYYWLQAVGVDGGLKEIAVTGLQPERRLLYLPEIRGK